MTGLKRPLQEGYSGNTISECFYWTKYRKHNAGVCSNPEHMGQCGVPGNALKWRCRIFKYRNGEKNKDSRSGIKIKQND